MLSRMSLFPDFTATSARLFARGDPVRYPVPGEEHLHVLAHKDRCSICSEVDRDTPSAEVLSEDGHNMLRVIFLESEEAEPA